MKRPAGKQGRNRRRRRAVKQRRAARTRPAAKVKVRREEDLAGIDPKWRWHYRVLLALRNRLARDSETKWQEAAEAIEPHSMHLADSATDEFNHDLGAVLLAREENALSEVNEAMARIRHGTYGVCQATGKKIPARRLRVIPWCRYTCEAEERLEKIGDVKLARMPAATSLRGPQPLIPGTGKLAKEGAEEVTEESEEPEESETTQLVAEISTPEMDESEEPALVPEPMVATRRSRRAAGRRRRR